MNLAALAISDMNVIKKIYEVLPSELQEQIKKAYPSYFVTHKVGNRYKNTSTGNRYILAYEGSAVALVNLETGKIRETVFVDDVFNISEDEMKRVFEGFNSFILIKERK
jgi:hypothetical protein